MKLRENTDVVIRVLQQAKLLMKDIEVPESTLDQMVAEIEALRFQVLTQPIPMGAGDVSSVIYDIET